MGSGGRSAVEPGAGLPPGWRMVRLGDVAETALGKMLDKARPKGVIRVPYLRNVNVQWGRVDTSDLLEVDLSAEEVKRFEVLPGDLLVCEGGEIGRAAIWNGGIPYLAYQKALHRVRSRGEVDVRYLRYLLEHHAHNGTLRSGATGSTILHLPQVQLRRTPVPLPEAREQRRLVVQVEDHLSRIDAAASYTRRAQDRARTLRWQWISQVLTRASGRSHPLGSLVVSLRNGIFVSRPSSQPDGVPILRIGAVRALKLDLSDLRFTGKSFSQLVAMDALLNARDLLFTRYNGNPDFVGVCAPVPEGTGPLTYPDKLIRAVVDRDRVLPEFLALVVSVGPTRAEIRRHVKTTAGQAGISGRDLRTISVRVPPLHVQTAVVAEVLELTQSAERLTKSSEQSLHASSGLRRAVLAAAFSGRLTGHRTDEDVVQELAGV
jgi:type I restriction enzyme S subunit